MHSACLILLLLGPKRSESFPKWHYISKPLTFWSAEARTVLLIPLRLAKALPRTEMSYMVALRPWCLSLSLPMILPSPGNASAPLLPPDPRPLSSFSSSLLMSIVPRFLSWVSEVPPCFIIGNHLCTVPHNDLYLSKIVWDSAIFLKTRTQFPSH